MQYAIKYDLQKDSSPIWVTVEGKDAANTKMEELKDQGYNPIIDSSRSQMPWLKLTELGFDLYKDSRQSKKQFVLVTNGSPISQSTKKALIQGGFTQTDRGYTSPLTLRSSSVLKTLPNAKKVALLPKEIDYQEFLKKEADQTEKKDPMIGRKWFSAQGEREVIGSCKPDTKTLYVVKTQGQKHKDWYLGSDLEKIIVLDQDPETTWRRWVVSNPHDRISPACGYMEYHILKKIAEEVARVSGKPISFEGYDDFSFFLAKYKGKWNVFEQTTGLSMTATNGVRTQKEATTLAKAQLEKHAETADKLSLLLEGKQKIPQPGDVSLPPAKQKEFTLPKLNTYSEALAWIDLKAKECGSKKKLYSSTEYEAVYPTIQRLYSQEKEDMILEARNDVAEAGLSSGDQVFLLSPDKTSSLYGKLYFANTGKPRVKVHTEYSLLGGQIPSNKRVDWHKGWTKAEDQILNECQSMECSQNP